MWQKFKEQIPAIVVTAGLIIAAAVFMVRHVVDTQQAGLSPLREQNERLRVQAEENTRQIEAATRLVKEAITRRADEAPRGDVEFPKAGDERVAQLADAIVKRIEPVINSPAKSATEVERQQQEQVDRVATRLTDNLRPVLAQESAAANLRLKESEDRTAEVSRELAATQAAAQDALQLTREVSAMYYDSYKDKGVVMRLWSLPASLLTDTAKGNLINGRRDRVQVEQELTAKMSELEKRLHEIPAPALAKGT